VRREKSRSEKAAEGREIVKGREGKLEGEVVGAKILFVAG